MENTSELVGDLNEHIPLNKNVKKTTLCSCNEYLLDGPRFITTAFFVFTVVVTIALLVQIYYGDFQVIPHGSVATDHIECSKIGTQVLKKGGNSVDSAIAASFCLAVVSPHTCGLDAGGHVLIYSHSSREQAQTIDFAVRGSQLPKLVVGLGRLHQLFGHLAWKDLVRPSADLATNGFTVTKQLEQAIKKENVQKLYKHTQAGAKIKLETLANFLKSISEIPEQDLYDQIKTIDTKITNSLNSTFRNFNIFLSGTSTIGPQLLKTLDEVETLNFTRNDVDSVDYTYTLAKISMENYRKYNISQTFHEGTSTNVAVMDLDDLYVSVVMGMYQSFGSRNVTETGYILDVEGDIPLTNLPIVLVDRDVICAKRIVLGASNLATAVQIITSLVVRGGNATQQIESPRFTIFDSEHFGLEKEFQFLFAKEVLQRLHMIGQTFYLPEPYGSCNIVEKLSDGLNSHSDSRGGGIASRF